MPPHAPNSKNSLEIRDRSLILRTHNHRSGAACFDPAHDDGFSPAVSAFPAGRRARAERTRLLPWQGFRRPAFPEPTLMTDLDFWIDRAEPDDEPAIERLLDGAFGPSRHDKTSYRYRESVEPVAELRLVARTQAGLVGTVRCWPVAVGSNFAPALLLGPLAVDPAHRGHGIGSALMRRALDFATGARHNLVLLVGDLALYRNFGFVTAAPF